MNESLKAYIEDIKQLLEWSENAEVESEAFRKTLKKCLMSELEKNTSDLEERVRYERAGKPFNKTEIQDLKDFLESVKPPQSWREEESILNDIAIKLRRKNKPVKDKAIALGLASKVDYWANRKI